MCSSDLACSGGAGGDGYLPDGFAGPDAAGGDTSTVDIGFEDPSVGSDDAASAEPDTSPGDVPSDSPGDIANAIVCDDVPREWCPCEQRAKPCCLSVGVGLECTTGIQQGVLYWRWSRFYDCGCWEGPPCESYDVYPLCLRSSS